MTYDDRVVRIDSAGNPFIGDPPSAFHPKNKLVNFYEIATEDGNAVWGGEDPHSAVQWLRQSPLNSRLLVSCWEAGEEDARLMIEPIDITKIVYAVLAGLQ
jgi:hypothetical protein